MVDAELKHLVEPFLEKGERLQWVARPKTWRYLGGALGAMAFGVPFFGFAVFWELGVLGLILNESGNGPNWFMALFGIPFLAIGAAMFFHPLVALRRVRRTVYAVTDRRALLVLTGRKAEARGYHGHAFTPIQATAKPDGSGDVFFGADTGVDRFLLESGAGKGGPFSKVGFFGVPEVTKVEALLVGLKQEAARNRDVVHGHEVSAATAGVSAAQAEDTLETRRSTTADAHLAFKGAYDTSEAKLASFLKLREQWLAAAGRQAWGRYRSWVGGFALLFVAGMFALAMRGTEWDAMLGVGLIFGVVFALGTGIGFAAMKAKDKNATDELTRGRALWQAFTRLAADAHPKTKVHGWVDLGEARTTRPYRMANSFSSGALKTYHKHHWVRLVFATADGNKLAVSVVDRVKFKSGLEVSRVRHLRGRLEVASRFYDTRRLAQRFSVQGLEVQGVVRGDKTVLYFGGALEDPAQLPERLAGLYRILPQAVHPRM